MNENPLIKKVYRVVLVAVSTFALAAQGQSAFWTQTHGPEGGNIVGFVQMPDGEILASARSSGVFRSLDRGVTWQLANGNIALDYGEGAIWMGPILADADGYVYLLNGGAVLRGEKVNGNWHWAYLGDDMSSLEGRRPQGPSGAAIMSRNDTSQRVFVSAWTWEPTGDGGITWLPCVSYTDDHGSIWENVILPTRDPAEPALGVAVCPNGKLWAVTPHALYKSDDAGQNWTLAHKASEFRGNPDNGAHSISFIGAIAASPVGDLYVAFYGGDGTLRINPDGTTEELATYHAGNGVYFLTSFAFGPNGEVYGGVYQNGGVVYSTDRGETWQVLGNMNANPGMGWRSVWAVGVLPDGTVLAGTSGDGVLRLSSPNGDWSLSKTGMVGSDVPAVATDAQGNIYAAAWSAGLFRSEDQGASWLSLAPDKWVSDTMGVRDLAVNSRGTVFAAWHAVAVSTDRGLTWQDRWVGDSNPPDPGQTPRATCLQVDGNDRLIVGTSQGVFFTSDECQTWQPSGLTLPIYALATSPNGQTLSATVAWSGGSDGLYISSNAGSTWTAVPLFAGRWVLGTAVSPTGAIFVAPGEPLPDTGSLGIWRSTDGGVSWQRLPGLDSVGYSPHGGEVGLASVLGFNSCGVLFATTGGSMVRSADNGDTWESMPSTLNEIPNKMVLDMAFDQDGFCVLGTWGAGVFRSTESTLKGCPIDTTPPVIQCPADIYVPCSVDTLVPVTFSVTATDAVDSSPTVTCTPAAGSGFPVGTTVVTCTATDAGGNTASCSFKVIRAALAFTGFLPPIGGADATGGSFLDPVRTFKAGSTIPVKFTAACSGAPVLTGIHRLQVIKYSDATTSDEPIDATAQGSATTGNQFRLADGQWLFNLDTKATGMTKGIWQLSATLSDGSQHVVWIQLK